MIRARHLVFVLVSFLAACAAQEEPKPPKARVAAKPRPTDSTSAWQKRAALPPTPSPNPYGDLSEAPLPEGRGVVIPDQVNTSPTPATPQEPKKEKAEPKPEAEPPVVASVPRSE